MIETRFSELRFDAAARRVHGVVIRYGDVAVIHSLDGGTWSEKVLAGAFGAVADRRVPIVYQHDHNRPVAATKGGGAVISDTPEEMTLDAVLGDTRDAEDAYLNLKRGIFAGLSVRMLVKDQVLDRKARTREIRRAELVHVGLVDSPAYKSSVAEARSMFFDPDFEDRAGFSGSYEMGQPETISDAPGRAQVRKRKFQPGAFRESLADEAQEVGLLTSRNPQDAIASKRSGTLAIEEDGGRLIVTAPRVADTAAWRDLVARRDAGVTLALQPIVKADSGDFEDLPEPEGDGSALVRTYTAAKLLGFQITARPPKGATASETELQRWAFEIPLPV